MSAGRGGFSLAEVVVALPLVAVSALGAASAEGWAARGLARAEAREAAAAAAELVLDSLAQVPAAAAGMRAEGDVLLEWTISRAGGAAVVRLRARPRGAGPGDELLLGEVLAPPLPSLEALP